MSEFWIWAIVVAIWLAGSVASYFAMRLCICRANKMFMLSDRVICVVISLMFSVLSCIVALAAFVCIEMDFNDREVKW